MGKISLKEMNDYKTEGTESNSNHNDGFKNDAERDDDIKELELMEKYERLGDLVLTSRE